TVLAVCAGALALIVAGCSGHTAGTGPASAPKVNVPVVLAGLTSKDNADGPFSIAEVGPSGTVPHENLEGGVWVLFNKPVIALKTLDKPATT
ncbi:MAG TPA: hypothetical protein VFI08_06750, partial [Spirochaetia bacterium]|nr:hypothetical protein [Spirochaetia bacterium]